MRRRKNYIFTNRKHSLKGIMGVVLGMISLCSTVTVIYLTYQNASQAPANFGLSVLLALLFAIAGVIVSIISRFEADKFYLFSYLGIVISMIALAAVGLILVAGLYGIQF